MISQSHRLWVVIAVAGAVFAVLDLLDGFIALPLRECSSVIAAALLDLAGFAIERNGTVISTGRSVFDVVPACSGSTTLQVLVALGIVWCGSHPRLFGWRRALAMAIAVPLAIAGNGLRVAVLIALGDVQVQPVEGFLHSAIGVCTFCLVLGILLLLAERLAGNRASTWSGGWRLAALLALLAILAFPITVWCATAWTTSPLDHHGWMIAVIAIAAAIWFWPRLPEEPAQTAYGIATLIASLLLGMIGLLVEINALQAAALICTIAATTALLRGPRNTLRFLPIWAMLLLATPVSGFALTRSIGITGPLPSVILRFTCAACLLVVLWLVMRRQQRRPIRLHALPTVALACAGLAVAVQIGTITRGREAERLSVSISYLQSDWVGDDLPVGEQTRLFLGRDHICSRRYRDSAGRSVDVIITSTGGDRHRAHPPEYCLTGAGWALSNAESREARLSHGAAEIAERRFRKDAQEMVLLYWFTDGQTIRGSYAAMLGDDTLRRLRGIRSDWILIRLIGPDPVALRDFAAAFAPVISHPPRS